MLSGLSQDIDVFMAGLRVLGNLSLSTHQAPVLINLEATAAICKGIFMHADSEQATQMAIDVLGNLACSVSDPDTSSSTSEEEGDQRHCLGTMIAQGGASAVLCAIQRPGVSASTLVSGLDALGFFCQHPEAVEELLPAGERLLSQEKTAMSHNP